MMGTVHEAYRADPGGGGGGGGGGDQLLNVCLFR